MRGTDHLGALRRGALIATSALVAAGIVAPAAQAALANGAPSETQTRPDLRSVALTTGPSAASERVRFCFDVMLASGHLDPTGFAIAGYDSAQRTDSTNAVFDVDDDHCVIAVFPADADLPAATVGIVADDAVRALSSGKSALGDAAPFADSVQETEPGRTDAPDLVSATPDASFNEIVFRFDRRLGSAGAPGRYVYYDAAGNREVGVNAALDLDNRRLVRVTFPAGGARSVRDAMRAAVLPATVTAAGAPAKAGPGLAVAVDGRDGTTARPDLVSASKSGPNSIDFAFDQPVGVADVGQFTVYRSQASAYVGQNATVLTSRPNVVRVWFGVPAQQFFEQVVVAVVGDDGGGAVWGTNGSMVNTIGSAPVGAIPNGRGFTSAPDATGVAFDTDEGTATISFDQPVDDTAAFAPADFRLLDRFGNDLVGASSAVATVAGSQVKLIYGAGRVGQGAAVQLRQGAVRTFAGDLSVLQVIGRGATPVVPATGGGTSSSSSEGGGAAGADPSPAVEVAAGSTATGRGAQEGSAAPATEAPRPAAARIAWARLRATRDGRYQLSLRITGRPRSVRVRIAVLDRRGRTVGVIVRKVRTNRVVRIEHLRAVPRGRLRISVAS